MFQSLFLTFIFLTTFFHLVISAFCNLMAAELKQSKFFLHFTNGAHYHLFEDQETKTSLLLDWNLLEEKEVKNDRLGLIIKLRQLPFAFSSPDNKKLFANLFYSEEFEKPIMFHNEENSNQTIIWKKKHLGQQIQFPIGISIMPKQMVTPGEYRCYLEISLVSADQELLAEETVELVATVAPSQIIELLIDGESGSKTQQLNFGEIQESSTRTFHVQIASNVPYEIQCKSLNAGRLRMTTEWRKINYATIDMVYTMHFQEKKLDLGSGFISLLQQPLIGSIQAIKYPIVISVHPNLKKNWEGIYKDEILFSIRPSL